MSKAKQTPRSGAGSAKATPRDAVEAEAVQLSVLVVLADALEHDEAVRLELKRRGFVVKHQALVHLSTDAARQFVLNVCDPRSAMYRPPTPQNNTEADGTTDITGAADDTPVPVATGENQEADEAANEIVEHAIHALANGPALVLGAEKANAVHELRQLAPWAESATPCLRSRFAKEAPRLLGLRCSEQLQTAEHELSFLMAHSGNRAHRGHDQAPVVPWRGSPASPAKSAVMGLAQLLNFLFPEHLQHPNSAGRLFVFGLYGPLDEHSRLRSGEKGLHVVTDRELTTMSARMVLAVYGMCSLSQEEKEVVV